MPTILRESKPIARKEHRCSYCGAKIEKGIKYRRATLKYDGDIYDWVEHFECHEITHELDMWNGVYDEGLTSESFCDTINDYIWEHHYDKEIDDIAEDWQHLTTHEAVLKILKEDFKKEV